MNSSSKALASIYDENAIDKSEVSEMESIQELLNDLRFPKVMNEESLAEVITACILKKAYLTSCRWSKWILLAALEELLGRSAPVLDEKQLRDLQEDWSKVSPDTSPKEACPSSRFEERFTSSSQCNDTTGSSFNLDLSSRKKDFHNKFIHKENAVVKNDSCMPHITPEDLYAQDIAIQCTPQIMGIIKNKRLQTNDKCHERVLKTTSTQTFMKSPLTVVSAKRSVEPLSKDVSTQTFALEKGSIKTTTRYTQTKFVMKRDVGTQSKPPWQLISVSLGRQLPKPRKAKKYLNLGKAGQAIKLFHERPLIEANSNLDPALIPLEPVFCLSDLNTSLTDPRTKPSDRESIRSRSLSSEFLLMNTSFNQSSTTILWSSSTPEKTDMVNFSMDIEESFSS